MFFRSAYSKLWEVPRTLFWMPYRRIPPGDFKEVKDHIKDLQSAGLLLQANPYLHHQ